MSIREVDAHPIRRPDPLVAALLEELRVRRVVRVRDRAYGTARSAALQRPALELGVHLGVRVTADVEPHHGAVVRLVAEVSVADDLAVADRQHDVACEARTAVAASTSP